MRAPAPVLGGCGRLQSLETSRKQAPLVSVVMKPLVTTGVAAALMLAFVPPSTIANLKWPVPSKRVPSMLRLPW